MVFVALGTHEQPMTRLLGPLAALTRESPERGPFVIQHGSTPLPEGWSGEPLVGRLRLIELIRSADVVVTHGGPATIEEARTLGKIPIVVPRRSPLGEHVSDNQLPYARRLGHEGKVLVVPDPGALGAAVRNYEKLVSCLPPPLPHDPHPAIRRFAGIADRLLADRG